MVKFILFFLFGILLFGTSSLSASFKTQKQELILKHPAWESAVSIEENRLFNIKTNEYATLLFQTSDKIIVKWDKYDIECFVKEKEKYVLSDACQIDKAIQDEYDLLSYDFKTPYIKLNPYGKNPLVALIKFPIKKPAQITLRIKGIAPADDIVHTFKEYKTEHTIPIYGLYPNHKNIIELTARFKDGTTQKSVQNIKTGPINSKFFYIEKTKKDYKSKYYYGSLFQNNIYDEYGYIRFLFNSVHNVYYINNRLVEDVPTMGLNIYNKLGKLLYSLPYNLSGKRFFRSFRHGVESLPDDRYLVIGTYRDTQTQWKNRIIHTGYDILLELPHKQNNSFFDLANILNPGRDIIFEKNYNILDWAHTNAVQYIPQDKSLVISMKHIGFIKTDYKTGQLKWIAAPHLNWNTSGRDNKGPALTDKLLTAVDKDLKPFPKEIQTGAVRSEKFSWPINNHDIRAYPGGLYTIFSNNGPVNDKRLMTKHTSEVMIYKIDEKAKTIQMLYKYSLPDFSSIASSAFYFPQEKELFIYAAVIPGKNNPFYQKIYRIDIKTNKIIFEGILHPYVNYKYNPDLYHYNMRPVQFYEQNE